MEAMLDTLSEDQVRFLALMKILAGQVPVDQIPKPVADVMETQKVVYAISKELWEAEKDNFLASKESFDSTLKKFLSGKENGKVVLVLPGTVGKGERHRIHTFSKKGLVSSVSQTCNDIRVMKIVLEYPFVVSLKA
jgi:hypothetical protein